MEEHYWIESREEKCISAMVHTPNKDSTSNPLSSFEKSPLVLYCHGFTGNKTGDNRMGVNLARALCQAGYIVVRFDFIGSGDSEGNFATDTHFSGWIKDLNVMFSWSQTLPQVNPERIGLIGHSLGGALITQFASLEKNIKALCALAPVSYLEENFKQIIIGPSLWEKGLQGQTIHNFYNKKYSLSPYFMNDLLTYDIQRIAPTVIQPYLIIHGEKDVAVPVQNSYDLIDLIGSRDKKLKIFADEEHLFSEKIHDPILEWFATHL